jgi:hypothetical protein
VIRSPHYTITTLPSDVEEINASIILDHNNFLQAVFPFADLDALANGERFLITYLKVIYPLKIVYWHAF